MILRSQVHHPNDVTLGYLINVMPEELHKCLGLPGKFVKNYPRRIIRRDGSEREMDWLMLAEPDNKTLFEKILINVEFQSSRVGKDKIKTMFDYKDYSKTYYGLPVLTIVVITNDYKYSEKEYSKVPSDIFKPHYIHMNDEEVTEKLKNIENNIDNLSDYEAINMVLLPMFASKKLACEVTEKLVKLFKKNKTLNGTFRSDIAFALSLMVKKYFDSTKKAKEMLKMMNPEVKDSRLRDVIEFEVNYAIKTAEKEYNEKINKQEQKINEQKNEIIQIDKENERLKGILESHNISY